MSDQHDLIRACKSEPDDDAPRLILADWLEDRGEKDRAAFIRRQVTTPEERSSGCEVGAEWSPEWRRWADSWQQENEGWVYPLHWERGFLRIGDYYRELYDSLSAILQPALDWTWVEEIRFGSWHDGDWSPLFGSLRLVELNRLEFIDDGYRSNLVGPLADCPFLTGLRHLRLYLVHVGDEGAKRLSESSGLSGLRSLHLDSAGVGRRGMRAFANSAVWDRLRECNLRSNRFGDTALMELANGRRRSSLTGLDLGDGLYTDRGLLCLSRSECFPALRNLGIGFYDRYGEDPRRPVFGRRGIESLLISPHLTACHLVISILSRHPVPEEIVETARDHPDRVVLQYINPSRP